MKILILLLIPLVSFSNTLEKEESLVKEKKKYHFETFESLRIDFNAGQSLLSSSTYLNTNSSFKSSKMINFDIKYVNHWKINHRSYIGVGFTDLTYKKDNSLFENDLSSIRIGHSYNPHYRLSLEGEIQYLNYFILDQNFIFRSDNSLSVKGLVKLDIYHKYRTRVGVSGGISLLKETAYLYDLNIYYRKVYRTFSLELSLYNNQGLIQNTQYQKTSINNGGIGSKISIPFR